MASGEWIAFTDDDCVPAPDWITQLLRAADGADVVQGRTQPDPGRAHLLSQPFSRSMQVDDLNGYFQTCNILYRRSLLEELGGFDHSFRFSAEDTDLGWRAQEADARVVFAPDALVTHDVVVGTFRDDLRGRRRWADVVQMVAKHPDARRLAWRPYVYRRTHAVVLVYVAVAALAVPHRTRAIASALAVTMALREMTQSGSPERVLPTLQARLGDAYEVWIVVRESARHRTLLL